MVENYFSLPFIYFFTFLMLEFLFCVEFAFLILFSCFFYCTVFFCAKNWRIYTQCFDFFKNIWEMRRMVFGGRSLKPWNKMKVFRWIISQICQIFPIKCFYKSKKSEKWEMFHNIEGRMLPVKPFTKKTVFFIWPK